MLTGVTFTTLPMNSLQTIPSRVEASQPEREVVGDNSAGETTDGRALKSTVEPPPRWWRLLVRRTLGQYAGYC